MINSNKKYRHRLTAAFIIFLVIIIMPAAGWAYEDKPPAEADSLLITDTLRKAVNVNISPERINVQYDDGGDTLILRALDRSGGRSVFSPQNNIISIGKDELIDVLDSVRGKVFLLFGDLEVRGFVKGDINVILGNTHIRAGASIEGPIWCLGQVTLDSGTQVWGDIEAMELIRPEDETSYDLKGKYKKAKIGLASMDFLRPQGMPMMLAMFIAVLILVGCVTVTLPRPVARVRHQIDEGFFKCLLVGVLLSIAILPVFVLILISIIGVPIAFLIYPFVVIGALALGGIGFIQYSGFVLGKHTTLRYEGYIRTTIAGIFLLGSPFILSAFFRFINLWPIAWGLQFLFLTVQFIMFTTGLGAVFFSRFGTLPKRVRLEPRFGRTGQIPRPEQLEAETDI